MKNRPGLVQHETGFTLVELMVGIVISMLVVVAVMASARYLESQKRLNLGVNRALETLTIATNSIADDIRMAGSAMTYGGKFSCKKSVIQKYGVTAATDINGFLPPISWVDGGDGLSDSLRVVYADAPFGIATTTISGAINNFTQPVFDTASGTSSVVDYARPFSSDANAALSVKAMLTNDTNGCQIVAFDAATGISSIPNTTIQAGASAIPIYDFHDLTYSIQNNALWVHDNFVVGADGDHEVAADIVFMKVYGLVAGSWFAAGDLTPFNNNASLSAQLGVTAPSALRLFIVAREQNFNAKVGGVCIATTQTALEQSMPWYINGNVLDPAVDLTATADWDCYKYKAIDIVVPLRNLSLGLQK
jgi:type IV pilus assembly protein PilW